MIRTFVAVVTVGCSLLTTPASEAAEAVLYDEAKQGDFARVDAETKPVRIDKVGSFLIRGHGKDAVDDIDSFVFEVSAGKVFDICIVGDAAEFKKLYSIDDKGTTKEVAFGSTNLGFGKPRNIVRTGLAPGRYQVDLAFGPDGAAGDWTVRVSPRDTPKPTPGFDKEAEQLTTATKMKHVDWPGAICIFHGHNWVKDDKYPVAIAEAGFGATGSTEWQIDECRKHGLRAFVFIWPHEATTIPKKHKDNKTVLGYYLSDRIPPQKWGVWATYENNAFAGDPKHPAFFTMKATWGGIDRYCPNVRARAMEFYHYHWDGNRKPHLRYAILEQYRRASRANGDVPICRVVETRAEDVRKTRQTIFTSLAYGVRGFRTGGRGLFDTSKRDERGVPTRTKYGEEFVRINAAIRAYSPVFEKARCHAVYHTTPLPAGCVGVPKDAGFQLEGKEVLVGVFRTEKKSPSYLLLANRDATTAHKANLTLPGKNVRVRRMDKRTGKWVAVPARHEVVATRVSIELAEGDGELLEVADPNAK